MVEEIELHIRLGRTRNDRMHSEHQSQTKNDSNFFRYIILRKTSCDVRIDTVMTYFVVVSFLLAPIESLSHFRIYDFIV